MTVKRMNTDLGGTDMTKSYSGSVLTIRHKGEPLAGDAL